MNRVFETSHVAITDGAEVDFRVEMETTLQPPRSGNQPALVTIRLREAALETRHANAASFHRTCARHMYVFEALRQGDTRRKRWAPTTSGCSSR